MGQISTVDSGCDGAPARAFALVLCYSSPELGATGKLVWAVLTYNALMIMYAANNIPYCALSGVMTGDTNERTNLASWRFLWRLARRCW